MSSTLLFIANIFILVAGQVAFKFATRSIPEGETNPLRLLLNPIILAALSLYGVGALLWILVLKRFPLSVAYPVLSITYIFVMIAAALFFQEQITIQKVAGAVIIMIGIFVLSRGGM